jgi:hypothetical protein
MKERPILFNDDMVRAILSGQKTQTRRPVRPQPLEGYKLSHVGNGNTYNYPIWSAMFYLPDSTLSQSIKCPFGQPGDRLYVRETWKQYEKAVGYGERFHIEKFIAYKADETINSIINLVNGMTEIGDLPSICHTGQAGFCLESMKLRSREYRILRKKMPGQKVLKVKRIFLKRFTPFIQI